MESIILVGKPNSGKTLLFNKLTGLRQKVANFPGVTVEVKTGSFGGKQLSDYPGVYSLNPLTEDENIAVRKFMEAVADHNTALVLCVLDATRLERSLALGLQAKAVADAHGKQFVYVLNMMDDIDRSHGSLDVDGLAQELAAPVFPVSARTGKGLDKLKEYLKSVSKADNKRGINAVVESLSTEQAVKQARYLGQKFGPKADVVLRTQNNVDRILLSSVWGGVIFALIMVVLFQAIFTWATPAMDLVEEVVGAMGEFVVARLPEGAFADFVMDAIFGGFGSFLVFVPQVFMLIFIIGILEDSGYLARAAVICHKPLSLFGLSGRSFVPLLSGHACAIPAIYAARTIESPRHRLLTIMSIPLLSCSARLPVYGLFVSMLIPSGTILGGLIGWQGLSFFGLYFFGIVVAMLVTSLIARLTPSKPQDAAPFILELPPYRLPHWKPLLRRSLSYAWTFISRAGLMIFMVNMVVWLLGYFPNGSEHLETSYLAQIGHWIEPIMRPLGVDWKFGVAVIASFLAREVFVGTLGTLFGISEADEHVDDIIGRIRDSGALTVASGFGMLVFYVIALQCVATLAVIRKETGKKWLATALFLGYGALAYFLAFITKNLLEIFIQ